MLQSIGGGCVEFFHPENSIKYNCPNPGSGISQWCNDQGVIAYRQPSQLERLQNILNAGWSHQDFILVSTITQCSILPSVVSHGFSKMNQF